MAGRAGHRVGHSAMVSVAVASVLAVGALVGLLPMSSVSALAATSYNLTDPPIDFATIIVEKRAESEQGDLLVGACFRLDGTDLAPDYPERCDDTDAPDGRTFFVFVEPGTYTVIETVTPSGYDGDELPPFAVTPGEIRTVTVVNQLLPTATATATDAPTSTATMTESPTQTATPTVVCCTETATATVDVGASETAVAGATQTAAAAQQTPAAAPTSAVRELPDTGRGPVSSPGSNVFWLLVPLLTMVAVAVASVRARQRQ
jgi:uncharacterized surface anchored protein